MMRAGSIRIQALLEVIGWAWYPVLQYWVRNPQPFVAISVIILKWFQPTLQFCRGTGPSPGMQDHIVITHCSSQCCCSTLDTSRGASSQPLMLLLELGLVRTKKQ